MNASIEVALGGPLSNEVETRIQGAADTSLRVLSWPVEGPRGRVQIVHGLSEHMGRYRGLAAVLNAAGYSVWGHDHRGHGKSEGKRGVVGRFSHLMEDVASLRRAADTFAPGPGRPALVAHSMGALVALRALQSRSELAPSYVGVLLSAPWLATATKIPVLTRLAIPFLRLFARDFPVPRALQPEGLTRIPEFMQAYAEDPLVVRVLAVSFFDQVQREQALALREGLPEGLPCLVVIPEADTAADPVTSARWAEGLDPAPEIWSLPGTRHEPFNDVGRNNIFERLVHWLEQRFELETENP